PRPPTSTLFPYTTLFRSIHEGEHNERNNQQHERRVIGGSVIACLHLVVDVDRDGTRHAWNVAAYHQDDAELAECVCEAESKSREDRKSTRLNSSHVAISY